MELTWKFEWINGGCANDHNSPICGRSFNQTSLISSNYTLTWEALM